MNFDVKKSTRKCYEDQQEFQPGEVFYSSLLETADGVTERRDFCCQHWEQPESDQCLGWWKAQVPVRDSGKVYWAPRHVLLSYFEHTLKQQSTQDLAYVTALLLVQKKILVMYDDGEHPQHMKLLNRLDRTEHLVPVQDLDPQRIEVIQDELAERLFMDEPVDESENQQSE